MQKENKRNGYAPKPKITNKTPAGKKLKLVQKFWVTQWLKIAEAKGR